MADLTLAREYQGVLDDVATLAIRDALDLFELARSDDASQVVRALLEAGPAITETYGAIAATVGAQFYDETRAAASLDDGFRATPTSPAPEGQVAAMTRWSVGPLFAAEPDAVKAAGFFAEGVDRLVRLPYRRTVLEATGVDPEASGAVRVTKAGACAFCLMLASRGVEHVDLHGNATHDRWHRNCKCTAAPAFGRGRDDYPDPDDLYGDYLRVTAGERGTGKLKAWRRHIAELQQA